ncbi:MAG: hypothetical protein UT66_C0022G0013 [candidate division CPR2 bacterium GW2011_GWC1_39_9]|uniref:Uncharacterized protein n=1 Tax=candidate division CPR2 bacterium GW2011_GWC2_39_10 TaxID=1618345 RepID=A0A0G0M3C0_UNCC2|nr:MAG: hypothetical protein UT18_C0007G0111 [candidate division CPR2 bacterium GW2011_GWC2_39_10]KKR34520.1 MAG: hypothetical protein UT66_C0022G0013 [candidate division CPR2 bacterium GW2011_GWC1_39_9]
MTVVININLRSLYAFRISDGEITYILENTGKKLLLQKQKLKRRILKSKSFHVDESGWQTLGQKNFNWVIASGDTERFYLKWVLLGAKAMPKDCLKDT